MNDSRWNALLDRVIVKESEVVPDLDLENSVPQPSDAPEQPDAKVQIVDSTGRDADTVQNTGDRAPAPGDAPEAAGTGDLSGLAGKCSEAVAAARAAAGMLSAEGYKSLSSDAESRASAFSDAMRELSEFISDRDGSLEIPPAPSVSMESAEQAVRKLAGAEKSLMDALSEASVRGLQKSDAELSYTTQHVRRNLRQGGTNFTSLVKRLDAGESLSEL